MSLKYVYRANLCFSLTKILKFSVADAWGRDFIFTFMVVNRHSANGLKTERKIFILRYWADCSIAQIAEQTGYGESKIKMTLLRTRNKLREELGKEGITV